MRCQCLRGTPIILMLQSGMCKDQFLQKTLMGFSLDVLRVVPGCKKDPFRGKEASRRQDPGRKEKERCLHPHPAREKGLMKCSESAERAMQGRTERLLGTCRACPQTSSAAGCAGPQFTISLRYCDEWPKPGKQSKVATEY